VLPGAISAEGWRSERESNRISGTIEIRCYRGHRRIDECGPVAMLKPSKSVAVKRAIESVLPGVIFDLTVKIESPSSLHIYCRLNGAL